MVAQTVRFRAAVDVHTDTQTGIEIDVLVVQVREADGGHDDEIVEIMSLVTGDLFAQTVTRHVVPVHKTDVRHAAEREPAFVAVLVLDPYMLVVVVILVIHLPVRCRHRLDTINGVVPDQTLE